MDYGEVNAVQTVTPLLANFAVPRTGSMEIPGHYSESSRLWVIEVSGQHVPIISAIRDLAECVTKTAQKLESDDESRPRPNHPTSGLHVGRGNIMLELATKTETRAERDD